MKIKSLKKLFFIISLIVSAYVFLVVVDIVLPRIDFMSEKAKLSKTIIKDYKEKKLKNSIKNQKDGIHISFPVYYNLLPFSNFVEKHNFVPLGSLPSQKTILSDEGYGNIIYKSDRFGFRNNDELWNDVSKVETVIIGDSFVAGHCVEDSKTISSVINKLDNITLNLGQGGYSGLHYEFISKVFLPIIKPKNVILVFYANDNHLIDLNEIHAKYIKNIKPSDYVSISKGTLQPSITSQKFYSDVKQYIIKNKISNMDNSFINKVRKLKKYLLLTNLRKEIYLLLFPLEPLPSVKSAIDKNIKLCLYLGCNLQIALIENSSFWDPDRNFYKFKKALSSYLNKNNRNLITFEKNDNPNNLENYALKGGHLSPKGYKAVAEHLIKFLK